MKTIKYFSLTLIAFVFIIGCSGNYANIKNQSVDESRVTQKKLTNNWSDYNTSYSAMVIVFDPKKDDKKIIVGNYWRMVKDQETWTQLVNGTAPTSFRVNQVWGNEIREIWGPDNKFYGYVTHQPNEQVNAQIVDENTVRLFYNSSRDRRVWN
jgi:hypothetical protein